MAPTALVVLTTLATDADARTLVTALLAERLIACGTLLPGGRSMYRWEGEVNEESVVVVLPALGGALRPDPENVGLLGERARRLAAARHYTAAVRDLQRALRNDPVHADALAAFGVVLSRKGLWSEAVPFLRRVVEAEPGRAVGWYQLGEALNKIDDLPGARAASEPAVELAPRNAKALYRLGIVLDRLRRPEEATRMYRRSREAADR